MLVKELSLHGFEVSSGSACSSPKNSPSHVIEALGVPKEYLYGSLRISLGKYNKPKDVHNFVVVLKKIITMMRSNNFAYNNESIFISQKELKELLSLGEKIQVIDVRHIKYPNYSIPNSIFIPIWRLKSSLSLLNKEIKTIVVCFQGDIISPQAHQLLVKNKFVSVKVLKGGIFNFEAKIP
jgi:rhodanese-related sulfurtransferase